MMEDHVDHVCLMMEDHVCLMMEDHVDHVCLMMEDHVCLMMEDHVDILYKSVETAKGTFEEFFESASKIDVHNNLCQGFAGT